jgi:hypothetical protein
MYDNKFWTSPNYIPAEHDRFYDSAFPMIVYADYLMHDDSFHHYEVSLREFIDSYCITGKKRDCPCCLNSVKEICNYGCSECKI